MKKRHLVVPGGIVPQTPKDIDTGFKWRDKRGGFHKPSNMQTRHVYYTLRMIWNHSAPDYARVTPYRHYTHFNEYYTPEYMGRTVKAMFAEIQTRNDPQPHMQAGLSTI